MFGNTGKIIKIISKIVCWFGIIGSVVASVIFFALAVQNRYAAVPYLGIAIGCLFGGPLASWLVTLLTYGFGDLIEKTNMIQKDMNEHKDRTKELNQEISEDRIRLLNKLRSERMINEVDYERAMRDELKK